MTGRWRGWRPPDPVAAPPATALDPAIRPRSDRCSIGSWPGSACPRRRSDHAVRLVVGGRRPALADHAVPGSLEGGALLVRVAEPVWATEWRYRQGEVLRRCDELLGAGVVARIEVRAGRR